VDQYLCFENHNWGLFCFENMKKRIKDKEKRDKNVKR